LEGGGACEGWVREISTCRGGRTAIYINFSVFWLALMPLLLNSLTCRSLTENTRASYPIHYIKNAHIPCIGGHPSNIILLCCDAFGEFLAQAVRDMTAALKGSPDAHNGDDVLGGW
jgi:hypothetical protein